MQKYFFLPNYVLFIYSKQISNPFTIFYLLFSVDTGIPSLFWKVNAFSNGLSQNGKNIAKTLFISWQQNTRLKPAFDILLD